LVIQETDVDTVLVTGANRGIGLGLVQQYLELGNDVIATCRATKLPKECPTRVARSSETASRNATTSAAKSSIR
jgi:short-subunit dehydrogenase involved in D-alanine esterification of teichoic acids